MSPPVFRGSVVKDTLDPCMQTALLLAVYCYALSSSFGIPYPKSIVQCLAILPVPTLIRMEWLAVICQLTRPPASMATNCVHVYAQTCGLLVSPLEGSTVQHYSAVLWCYIRTCSILRRS